MKFLSALLLAFSFNAFAGPQDMHPGAGGAYGNENSQRPNSIQVGGPAYAGSGCPDGTMRVVFSPDNLSFSILFDQFVADSANGQLDPGGQRSVAIMLCNIVIPMTIPAGMQMSITRADYRGFTGLPQGSSAILNSQISYFGRSQIEGPAIQLRYIFQGPLMNDYLISSGQGVGGPVPQQTQMSPCGGDVRMRVINALSVITAPGMQASATLDSVDGSSNAIYYVNWRTCSDGPVNNPPPHNPPPPPSNQVTCQVNAPWGPYIGTGYDQGSALAAARNACIRRVGNARVCMSAPTTCH